MKHIQLCPLTSDDREQFIKDNQEAFNYGALEEFGRRDDHFEVCESMWIPFARLISSWYSFIERILRY